MDLRCCALGRAGARALLTALETNDHLVHLDLRGNQGVPGAGLLPPPAPPPASLRDAAGSSATRA